LRERTGCTLLRRMVKVGMVKVRSAERSCTAASTTSLDVKRGVIWPLK
jgi:hypothetical protein